MPPTSLSEPAILAPASVPSLTNLDLPIALRKGTRHCTQHPISHHVSTTHFSSSYSAFSLFILSGSIPKTYLSALQVQEWKVSIDAEYAAFLQRETWQLVPCLSDVNVVSCKWVYDEAFYAVVKTHKRHSNKDYNTELTKTKI